MMLAELGGDIDPERVLFPGRIDYATYLRLLQRSDAHVYLTYPFVASWSLREALAAGCVVIGSDTPTVQRVRHARAATACWCRSSIRRVWRDTVLRVLEDAALARRLREGARGYAEQNLAMGDYIAAYEALIGKLTAG